MFQRARDHLRENDMTYLGHMRFALHYGTACIQAGLRLLAHAVHPGVYRTAGRDLLRRLRTSFDRDEENRR